MRTTLLKEQDVQRDWYIVDADGQTLGRLAARVAGVLVGKHKSSYTPHADGGDFVVVINAAKIHLTGKKWNNKEYIRHSQFPGGLRRRTAAEVHAADPTRIVQTAIKGMLPINHLRAPRMKRLRVFAGSDHQHAAQKPKLLQGIS